MRSLASLLELAEGSPSDRARLARTHAEAISLLLEPGRTGVSSVHMRLAAVRAGVLRLYAWCPDLREAETIAAASALCLAGASVELSRIAGPEGPDLFVDDPPSWDEFIHRRGRTAADQQKILRALRIKRELLTLISRLEAEAEGQPTPSAAAPTMLSPGSENFEPCPEEILVEGRRVRCLLPRSTEGEHMHWSPLSVSGGRGLRWRRGEYLITSEREGLHSR